MKKHAYWLALVLLLTACSKKNDNDDNNTMPGNEFAGIGAGILYYNWATDGSIKLDLKTGVRGTFLGYNTRLTSWDVSRDNTLLLTVTDAGSDYDSETYTITNIKDNTIVSKFLKATGYANYTFPTFSYDKTRILVPPTDDDGILIMDLQGKILFNLVSFQGQELGSVVWMPDNTILFNVGNSLYRSNKEFTTATLVKTLNFASWGNFSVSPDGSKIALQGGNHLWMMNADGSNLTQITESNSIEVVPVFSPDSKYLLVGSDYTITNQWGRYWYLDIIPADFNKYNFDKGADKRVIPVIAKGETSAEPSDGNIRWR